MKHFFSVVLVFVFQIGFSQGVSQSQARALYFSMGSNQSSSLKLFNLMNVEKQSLTPLLLAYRGASSAAAAGQVDGVHAKFSYFKKGKADIDQAVKLDPKDPEIRFLRLATQTNAPGFLLYKGDIKQDKKIVLAGLASLLSNEDDHILALHMAKFLLDCDNLSQKEKQIVKQLVLQYERNN
ncbi:MAG: hypothetical protein ACOYMF_06650 [Bacteroidales bacterium]